MPFGGARTSLFEVKITNPANQTGDLQIPFLCEAASLPAAPLNPIPIHYFGRPFKVAGNREFGDWSVTIINDEDFTIRNAMEHWSNSINGFETNIRKFASSEHSLYKSSAEVTQFGQAGQELRSYKIVGIFPIDVSAIDLRWSDEQVQRFNVTFAVDYWYVDRAIGGGLAGGL